MLIFNRSNLQLIMTITVSPGLTTILKYKTLYVQYAEKAQSSNLQRPWSVHSEGESEDTKQ